ncbi:hypothetical protein HFO10_07185 [Rhizobium laguerreae]|uniref:hypothetical protein n=1 Tax=Rhizobium laguerreae TaxID=1076926 RepID=UPI001C915689|nr:hypothetical protein [Rhizobium laguerreae]MBY3086055.1 hypothetical protein [Rhizobium laguerreae]MBY3295749.1 hypothetical protein [Rhizobium laguerreae]MBY3500196.1 hypothetical protein [Rhizobium laguerreae]
MSVMADEARLFLKAFPIYNRLGEGDPFMQAKALVLVLSVALAGCQTQRGELLVAPDPVPGANHALQMSNTPDVGYNPDDKEDRERHALNYLKSRCPAGRVIKESVIKTGTDDLGRPVRSYMLYVKC